MSLTTKHKLLTSFWNSYVNDAESAIAGRQPDATRGNACDVVFFEMPGDRQLHVNVTHARQTVTEQGWSGPANTATGFVHNRVFGRAQASRIVSHVRRMAFASTRIATATALAAALLVT